jgi:cyclopropane fatty-acyl-phospholipid synthase-like methyltransferase
MDLPIDIHVTLFFMPPQKMSSSSSRQKEYARLRDQLAHTGWISQGYVQDRGPGAGGACYPWTRKVKGKTICVALSKEQYEWLKQAIANWRTVQETLRQMQRLSREELFETLPNPKRRKRLGKKVLGLV